MPADFNPALAERWPLRVLVADDYDLNQKLVARILQGFGTRLNLMLGEDRDTVREFLGEYLRKTSAEIEQLRAALNSANASEVELRAHRCRGLQRRQREFWHRSHGLPAGMP